MFHTKWRKGIRDLTINKTRSLLVILAIMIGVFGLSVVANSYSILMREMDKNYMNTNPSSATLTTDYLSASDIQKIKSQTYIADAEIRDKIVGRIQVGNKEWKDLWLFVIDDFTNLRLDTFTFESGSKVPEKGEILFERKSINFTGAQIGQSVNIKIPGGKVIALSLTGSVHAPGLAPSWMEGYAYGFISRETYQLLGGTNQSSELKIKVTGDTSDKEQIRDSTRKLKAYLESQGVRVSHIEIPEPGRHPHYTQMAALLFLMEVFGIVALLLSGVLISNMINSLLEQQIRQIGIMKTIGATSLQIAILYQGIVITLSCIAMLFAIPAGIYAGRGYAYLAAQILNFNIYSNHIPYYIFFIEIASGLLVPVFVSAVPIRKSSRITIREALQDYGIRQELYNGRTEPPFFRITGLISRPFLLSVRNTFRRKSRLILTLMVMAVGGCGFITAMNIYTSMYHTVDEKMKAFSYDIQISFDQAQSEAKIENVLGNIKGIKESEAWGGAAAERIYPDETTGNSFHIVAPPSDTKLMTAPPIYSGRWLEYEDTNAIVVNQQLLVKEPDLKIGDTIQLLINRKESEWKVVGISKELIGLPMAYVNLEYLSKLLGQEGYAMNAVIVTDSKTQASLPETAGQIEQVLNQNGMSLGSLLKLTDYRVSLINHLTIIASFLIAMSILVVFVGGLGLATSISISTMERTREIGIMRAIGAPSTSITGIIVAEGALIGSLSWFISLTLSWPISRLISSRFGSIFFEVPLEFAVSFKGIAIWFVIVILFAAAASYFPSRKASKMQINTALSYE